MDLIAVPSDTTMRARLYRGDGAGAFAAAGDLAIPAGVVADNANAIAVADYDEDGAPDLAIVAGTSISLISNGCLW